MIDITEEYRLSHRHGRSHYQRARLTGLIPPALALLFLYAKSTLQVPVLWMAIGLSVALHLILWAGYALHQAPDNSRLGRGLVAHSDEWFPVFLIVVQNSFISLTLLAFWFMICDLGFPATTAHHLLLLALVILAPIRRVVSARHHAAGESSTLDTPLEFLRALHACLLTALVAGLLSRTMLPQGRSLSGEELSPGILIVWVPACLIILACVVLFIDHVVRKRPAAAREAEMDHLT